MEDERHTPIRTPLPQCIAEVGSPGQFHGCKERAQWRLPVKGGSLDYCTRHLKARAGDTSKRHHSGATGEPRRIA